MQLWMFILGEGIVQQRKNDQVRSHVRWVGYQVRWVGTHLRMGSPGYKVRCVGSHIRWVGYQVQRVGYQVRWGWDKR